MQPSSPIKRLGRWLWRPRISLRGLLILVSLVSVVFFGVASVRRAYERDSEAQWSLATTLGFTFESDTILPSWVFHFIARERLRWFERASSAQCARLAVDGAMKFRHKPEELESFQRISDCRHLQLLWIEGLAINDQQLSTIANLRHLEHIHLNSLEINGESLRVLLELPNLRGVVIKNCPFEPSSLVVFSEIRRLRALTLAGFEVSSLHLRNLDVSELQALSLSETLVDDAISPLLARCEKLVALNLNGCKVTDATVSQLKNCRLLQSLFLDRTLVTGSGFEELTHLDLGIVHLEGSQLDDAGAEALAKVQSVELLVISRTKITAKGLKRLASLPKLIDLKADEVSLDPTALDGIKFVGPLSELSLNDSGIDDRGVGALLAISRPLAKLSVRRCSISRVGKARLRAKHKQVYASYASH